MLAPQTIEYVTKNGEIKTHVPPGNCMTPADIKRLGQKAEAEGVKVFVDFDMQEFIATSGSKSGQVYFVHPRSCECLGFQFRGRCKHVAHLLRNLHKL